jgi:hypothetical protein
MFVVPIYCQECPTAVQGKPKELCSAEAFLRIGVEQVEACSCMRVTAIRVTACNVERRVCFLAEVHFSHKLSILPSISNNFHMHSLFISIRLPSLE